MRVTLRQVLGVCRAAMATAIVVGFATVSAAQDYRYGMVTQYMDGSIGSKMNELGAGYIRAGNRTGCSWSWMQRNGAGTFDFSCAEQIIYTANSYGLRVYFTIEGTPWWAGSGSGDLSDAPDETAFGDFVGALINHFRGYNVVWGLWNEPNDYSFLHDCCNGAVYKLMVQAATAARNSTDPSARLATPECSEGAMGSGWYASVMSAILPYLASQDIVSVHKYPGGSDIFTYMNYQAGAYRGGHAVWLTETGSPISNPSAQSSWYNTVLDEYNFGGISFWQNVFGYVLPPNTPDSILYSDWSNTAAFQTYKSWISLNP